MRQHADYAYYADEYAGDEIPEASFPKYAKKASAVIDRVTFGRPRVVTDEDILNAVRDAVCAVAECLYKFDATRATDEQGREIASENNDGYSVTFRNTGTADAQNAADAAVMDVIQTYLADTGLLYRGISRRYDLPAPV